MLAVGLEVGPLLGALEHGVVTDSAPLEVEIVVDGDELEGGAAVGAPGFLDRRGQTAGMLASMTMRGEVRDAIFAISLNDDVVDRADAVWCLVRFIGEVEVDRRVVALARDSEDTHITETAIEALSFRGDLAAWNLIAEAYGAEDDHHTRGHMTDALERTVLQDWTRIDEARGHLSTLQMSPEPGVREGAIELEDWFADQLEAQKAQKLVSHKRWRRLFG